MKTARALTWSCALVVAAAAHAGSPVVMTMKCPIGGKEFTHIGTSTMSQWGSRPDGKPYGSWTFPLPLPVCPDNGLVLYREFSRKDIRRLKPLVAMPEYQAARGQDTPYFLAYWLMMQLGERREDWMWMLLKASWESDFHVERKRYYQELFVRRAGEWPRPADEAEEVAWFAAQLHAVNALRELRRFDEATQRFDELPVSLLDVEIPPEQKDERGYLLNTAERKAASERRSWLRYAEMMRKLVHRHDASSEPIDMVPLRVAAERCLGYPKTLPVYQEVCESDAMRRQLEQSAKVREILEKAASPSAPASTSAAEPTTGTAPNQ